MKTTARSAAETALARFDENLHLLERGRLELPAGADIGSFLLSDGKLNGQPARIDVLENPAAVRASTSREVHGLLVSALE